MNGELYSTPYGVSDRSRSRGRWKLMLRRCEDPSMTGYRYWGGRGIKVCERWHDFELYYADITELIGACPPGKSMDRIDNDGDYEPGNVRWATATEQARNKRGVKRWPEGSIAEYIERQTARAAS